VILIHGIKTICHECGSVVSSGTRYWLDNQGSFQFVMGNRCLCSSICWNQFWGLRTELLLGIWDLFFGIKQQGLETNHFSI